MSSPRPSLGPVLLTVLLDLLGFGIVIPLLTFYVERFGASPLQVTLVMACYSVAQFLCAPMWGALSDRVGRRPVMLASIAGSAVFLAAFAASTELWMVFLFRTLHGACAANIGTAQAIVADLTPGEGRARGMGLIGASFGVGFTLGPFLGGSLAELGLAVPLWVAAGLSAVNLVWAGLRLPETRGLAGDAAAAPVRTLHPRQLWAALAHPAVGAAVFLTFVAVFAFSMMEATFALIAEHVWSMDARSVGLLFGGIGAVGIVVQGGLIGSLTRRFGEPRLLTTGYLCTASGMATLAAAAGPVATGGPAVLAGCLLIAVGTSLANPSLASLVSRGASPAEQGAILGGFQSMSALARASAPATGGAIFSAWVAGGPFAVAALLTFGAALLSWPAARRAARAAQSTTIQV